MDPISGLYVLVFCFLFCMFLIHLSQNYVIVPPDETEPDDANDAVCNMSAPGIILDRHTRTQTIACVRAMIRRTERQFFAIMEFPDDWLWAAVWPELNTLMRRGGRVVFLVSEEHFDEAVTETMRAISAHSVVRLWTLSCHPEANVFFADNVHVYATKFDDETDGVRSCYYSNSAGAPREVTLELGKLLIECFGKLRTLVNADAAALDSG